MNALPPDIVARLSHGDAEAFELVFREHYAGLCAFAHRFVRDVQRSEDLVQDVFAALWVAREPLEIRTSLRAYLFAAVRNRALNARQRDAVAAEWGRDEGADEVRELHPMPAQPDELFDRRRLEQELAAAIDALPERCAMAMRLRWRDQMSYAEIAEALGISVKGVERLLSRGLQALRDRLG